MLLATARRRVAAWRQSRLSARLACALWIAWAVIIWNVVFDHAIVVAGRDYIAAAAHAAAVPDGPFANMDDWMRPAVRRGFWMATAAGAAVLLVGLAAISMSGRSAAPRASRGIPSSSRDERLGLRGTTR
jgi:hypothetical protein